MEQKKQQHLYDRENCKRHVKDCLRLKSLPRSQGSSEVAERPGVWREIDTFETNERNADFVCRIGIEHM